MPIPFQQMELPPEPVRPSLTLVASRERPLGAADPLWFPRLVAHLIDLAIVAGFSLYTTKLVSALLVAFHIRAIKATGKTAGAVFLETFGYGQSMLGVVVLTFAAGAYFVLLPAFFGRTFGLGLCGLRIEGEGGGKVTERALWRRLLACGLGYLTLGALSLAGMRHRDGTFLQDRVSGTRVVKGD